MDIYTHIDDAQKEQVKNWLQDGMEELLAPKAKGGEATQKKTS